MFSLVAICGSTFFLPPFDSRQRVHPAVDTFAIAGLTAFDAAIWVHIYKAWRGLRGAGNRLPYAFWMSAVTIASVALHIVLLVEVVRR